MWATGDRSKCEFSHPGTIRTTFQEATVRERRTLESRKTGTEIGAVGRIQPNHELHKEKKHENLVNVRIKQIFE